MVLHYIIITLIYLNSDLPKLTGTVGDKLNKNTDKMTSSINAILRKKCFILISYKICTALEYTIV